MNNKEETLNDYAMRVIKPHLQDIEELAIQMHDVIKSFAEELDIDMRYVDELANKEIIIYHIEKILEIIGDAK